jgi:hypothetical protein
MGGFLVVIAGEGGFNLLYVGKMTKEQIEQLAKIRDEVYAGVRKYNSLVNKIINESHDQNDDDYYYNNFSQLVAFERPAIGSAISIEPDEASEWLPSSFCD